MKSKILAGGLLGALMLMAMPASAYHVADCDRNSGGCGDEALNPTAWGSKTGLDMPVDTGLVCDTLYMIVTTDPIDDVPEALEIYQILCVDGDGTDDTLLGIEFGETLFSFTLCEVPTAPPAPGRAGRGGLCFMSPGYTDPTLQSPINTPECTFVGNGDEFGNGNGKAPPASYDTSDDTTAAACTLGTATRGILTDDDEDWMQYQVSNDNNAASYIAFGLQIDGISCRTGTGALATSLRYVVDQKFAYTLNNGHVTAFPRSDPLPGALGQPGFGGYSVTVYDNDANAATPANPAADTTPLTHCDGPRPVWYA